MLSFTPDQSVFSSHKSYSLRQDELLTLAQAGDRAALESLIESIQPSIYRFSLNMCGRADDAEDVLQETLLTVAEKLQDFRGASSFSTWLYAIARSVCGKKSAGASSLQRVIKMRPR